MEAFNQLVETTGLYNLTVGQGVMMAVCLLLIWLAIVKEFEPLLLLPIGFGGSSPGSSGGGATHSRSESGSTHRLDQMPKKSRQ